VELSASYIGAVIGGVAGVIYAGISWAAVGVAIVGAGIGFLAALLFTFLYYLVLSPKSLDEKLSGELSVVQHQLEEARAEHAKESESLLNRQIRAVEAEWEKLTISERKLLSQFALVGGRMTALEIKFFSEAHGLPNWVREGDPVHLYKGSGLLCETFYDFNQGWMIPERLREAVENVVYRHLDEQGGLGSFVAHGLIGDARAAEAERLQTQIEKRLELARKMDAHLKEGKELLRKYAHKSDSMGIGWWETIAKTFVEEGMGTLHAEEFVRETDIKPYPYPASCRPVIDRLYTLTERLGALISELRRG
jgi:hypothetical protein